jgi:nicotinic acid mononucleotide adenylyltransferase
LRWFGVPARVLTLPRTPVQHEVVERPRLTFLYKDSRAATGEEKSRESVRALVPVAVYDYIQHHQLYLEETTRLG